MRWLLLLCVACTKANGPPAPQAPASALDDTIYRFCHEAGVQRDEALEFCELLDDLPPERCPGLRETCAGHEAVSIGRGCLPGGAAHGRDFQAPPERPKEPMQCDTPELGSANLLRWAMAAAVAALVLVVMRLLFGFFGRPVPTPRRAPVVAKEPVEAPLDDVPDLQGDDLMSAAERALEAGHSDQAMLLARAASLRSLHERGALRLHRARTDREYLRSVRKDPELAVPLAVVLRAVEALRWGGARAGEASARAALKAARRLLALGVGLWLLLAPAQGQDWQRYGPQGDAALQQVFEAHGYHVSWRLRGLTQLDDQTQALVLDLSGTAPSDDDMQAVRTWVEAGGVLLVGGAWDATASPEVRIEQTFPELGDSVVIVPAGAQVRLVDALANVELQTPRWSGGPKTGWAPAGGSPWVVAEVEDHSYTLVQSVSVGSGAVLAISDATLLWNGALVHPANEAFLGDVLAVGQARFGFPLPTPAQVQLATQATGGVDSPAAAMANAHLLPLILQLLAFWLLVALWRGWPLGPPRDPPELGRRHFSEHTDALARRYQQLGASRHVAGAYARLWWARMGRSGLIRSARRAGFDADAAERTVAAVQDLVDHPDQPNQPSDLQTMEQLWTITHKS